MAIENDNYMTYDMDNHVYIPSLVLFVDKLNKNLELELGGKVEAELYAEDVALFIKDFITFYANPYNVDDNIEKVEYLIFNNDNGQRLAWQRACIEFVRYAINDEGDMVGIQTGLNIIDGQIVDPMRTRGLIELSSRLHRILSNAHLLYRGIRRWTVPDSVERGVDF